MKKILHITPNFNYSCGRSKLVFLYLKYFGNNAEYETHFITNGGDSIDRLSEITNLHFKTFNFSTGFNNILFFKEFYRKLKNYVMNNGIELIHTHHRFPELISIRIGRELNLKTVTSAHSFVKNFKRASFKSDLIISVSNSVSNYLKKYFDVKDKRIITLYNPVEQFAPIGVMKNNKIRQEHSISSDKRVLLFIGRINKVKGYDTLLKSFSIVKEQFKSVVLLLNGQIEDKNFNHNYFRKNGNVIFIPPQKENNQLYILADIVILPSRIEPFPFVMLEAGAFKKPFIGGNTGGISEFIEDGIDGLLVDSENPRELAEKIIYLLNNPGSRKMLGENLHEKVNRLCDFNNYFSEVEKIYNSLITTG